MKKVMIFTTLLAASTLSMAKGGFQDGNHHQGKQRVEQGFVDESTLVKSVKVICPPKVGLNNQLIEVQIFYD